MNKFAILLSLLFISFSSLSAQENESAYNVCSSLPFSSDQLECMNVIKDHFFENHAADVCKTLSFASDKMDCLKAIADKTFPAASLAICKQMSFASDKIKCLSDAGSSFSPCIEMDDIEANVYKALSELRRNDTSRARYTLEKLLDRIQDCRR